MQCHVLEEVEKHPFYFMWLREELKVISHVIYVQRNLTELIILLCDYTCSNKRCKITLHSSRLTYVYPCVIDKLLIY
jgi:hypothetical protein